MPYPPVILELFKSLKTQLDDIERERVSNQYTLNHIFKEQQNAQNDEKSAEVSFKAPKVIIIIYYSNLPLRSGSQVTAGKKTTKYLLVGINLKSDIAEN